MITFLALGLPAFPVWEARYGRVIKIQHSDGFVTVYAHSLQNFLEVGDEVYDPLHVLPALEIPPETGAATQPEEDEDDEE